MTTLEAVDSAESQAAVAYLLNLVMKRWDVEQLVVFLSRTPSTEVVNWAAMFLTDQCTLLLRVPAPVLMSKFSDTTKALMDVMSKQATSDTASALRWVSRFASVAVSHLKKLH